MYKPSLFYKVSEQIYVVIIFIPVQGGELSTYYVSTFSVSNTVKKVIKLFNRPISCVQYSP